MLLLSALIYFLFTRIYPLLVGVAAFFSKKARQWILGRFRWPRKAKELLRKHRLETTATRLWMHCASLGEFEQGRAVLELFKREYPQLQVLLSFFSPSGFEVRKNAASADWVVYLPMDSRKHAKQLLDLFKPNLVIFVKYEFWWYYLREIRQRKLPLFLIAARFRTGQPFFRPYGKWHRRMLQTFSAILVQDENSKKLLKGIGYKRVFRCGDPRVDRVLDLARKQKPLPFLEQFTQERKIPLLILGSTWPADEKLLIPWVNTHLPKGWKVLIAPHEIRQGHIKKLMRQLKEPTQCYTALKTEPLRSETRILILDTIGLLAASYRYGRLAYIGGGFGKGIHNILEPAAFGLPLLFGPRYKKFEEAVFWVERGAAFPIQHERDFERAFNMLQGEERLRIAKRELQLYLQQHEGAAACCIAKIREHANGFL